MSLSSVLILVWGAFRDIETYQGKPVQHVRKWIMQMYAEAARGLKSKWIRPAISSVVVR